MAKPEDINAQRELLHPALTKEAPASRGSTSLAAYDPDGLEAYFTDVEELRDLFKELVADAELPKNLLIIHGVGGAGKSSLLQMFRLHASRSGVPVGLASGDQAKSAIDILITWSDDLQAAGIRMPGLMKTRAQYRTLQKRVKRQAQQVSDVAGKLAVKTAEGVAGSVAGAAMGSVFPVIGTVAGAAVGALVGMSGEALVDWLSGFLKKPDIDLLLDPTGPLTGTFLADLAKMAARQRLVLMLDTFEQLSPLEDWTRDLARHVPPNVLLVIAGRDKPNWSRRWPGWLTQAQVKELNPMTPETMRELVQRYYAAVRGGEPDQRQVDQIVEFARGLPVVVTSVVQLWVAYGIEDFQAVEAEAVEDLVDRLLEGIPHELRPMIEAAATLRWFNKEILQAITDQSEVDATFDELRRFPFIRPSVEGLGLHASVREIIDARLRARQPAWHRKLHERAAAYYEHQRTRTSGAEAAKLGLELLYHRVRADEVSGIQLFRGLAEEFIQYRLLHQLRFLLTDVATYPLKLSNSRLWRDYYTARLAHLEVRIVDARPVYEAIKDDASGDDVLRAYVRCDLGAILRRRDHLRKSGGIDALRVLHESLRQRDLIDAKLTMSWIYLADVYIWKTAWTDALLYLEKARTYAAARNDTSNVLNALEYERGIYGRQGNFRKLLDTYRVMHKVFIQAGAPEYLKIRISPPWELLWIGYYAEFERDIDYAIRLARSAQYRELLYRRLRDLACCLGFQRRCTDALRHAKKALSLTVAVGEAAATDLCMALTMLGIIAFNCGDLDRAEQSLKEALKRAKPLKAHLDAAPLYLAHIQATRQKFHQAGRLYKLAQEEAERLDRNYFRCGALTGLVRIKHAQADYAAIPALLTAAEAIAQQYEYNDHLALLRLTQSHLAWEGRLPEQGRGFDAALRFYQQALIYALRYNRFLLDEVLWGGNVVTPLKPIMPHCLERTFEGQRMLAALHDWWQTGDNDLGTPRLDTISPIPQGISLLEAERIAREREPGDRTPQRTVLESLSKHI